MYAAIRQFKAKPGSVDALAEKIKRRSPSSVMSPASWAIM
jgi:hypothetical protein